MLPVFNRHLTAYRNRGPLGRLLRAELDVGTPCLSGTSNNSLEMLAERAAQGAPRRRRQFCDQRCMTAPSSDGSTWLLYALRSHAGVTTASHRERQWGRRRGRDRHPGTGAVPARRIRRLVLGGRDVSTRLSERADQFWNQATARLRVGYETKRPVDAGHAGSDGVQCVDRETARKPCSLRPRPAFPWSAQSPCAARKEVF